MRKLKRNDSGMWVLVAVDKEFAHPDANICYTGVGKVNAAISAQHIIDTENPKLIISIGTAGSVDFDYAQIINPTGWVQRDMNPTELGGPRYTVPFSGEDVILKYGNHDERYPESICGSGDSFVRTIEKEIWDCIDMEGFAIATACRRASIPFIAYKFISDGRSDRTTDHEWSETLASAQKALHRVYDDIAPIPTCPL
jgi:adenosylhomocysteine nucleosidase